MMQYYIVNLTMSYYAQTNRTFTSWFRSVVVITSALHAEGREFEPRRNLAPFLHILLPNDS